MLSNLNADILARTIYGEARGEFSRVDGGLAALIAIGNVVINRVNRKSWFGGDIREVCQKPKQFSCWNASDSNYTVIQQVTHDDSLFKTCLNVADNVICGAWPDLTKGADHYYAVSSQNLPYWAENKMPTVKIGQHLFFQLEV
ncbi:MAG: cell wall hydrolase [Holosporales bacterium]|jgi:spore germination cell wall hydrolase CwlJ-like protein|nr:cell wall hydrolase [Holosporales bacterium]